MNSIFVIVPYQWEGMWVFDDARVGLHREPFVSGADVMMDKLVANLPDAGKGFRLIFSETPFPGYAAKLDWRREEYGGNWYFSPQFGIEGWLCPRGRTGSGSAGNGVSLTMATTPGAVPEMAGAGAAARRSSRRG